MKSGKKFSKKKKAVIAVVLAAAVAAGGIFVSFQNRKKSALAAMQTSTVQSATVTRGTIQNTVTGTGTLAQSDATSITIPTGITIDEVLVSSGDSVTAGQELATVNKTSINTRIREIQNEISAIDTTLSSISEDTTDETVSATLSGTVSSIYIAVGDDVSEVMDSEGKLMTLTIDGDNATDIQITATSGTVESLDVSEGDEVSQGDTLFTLTGVEDTSERDELLAQRSDLTDLLDEMLQLQKTGTITSPSDGIIQDVNVSDGTEVTKSSSDSSSSSSTTSGSGTGSATRTSSTSANRTAALMTAKSSDSSGFTLMTAADVSTTAEETDETDQTEEMVSAADTGENSYSEAAQDQDLTSEEAVTGSSAGDAQEETFSGDTDNEGNTENAASQTTENASSVIEGILNLPITTPTVGQKAMTKEALTAANQDTRYQVTGLEWNIDANSTFSSGNAYSAYVTLTADDGYYFSSQRNGVIIKADNANGAVAYTLYDEDGDGNAEKLIAVISYSIVSGENQASANANSAQNQTADSINDSNQTTLSGNSSQSGTSVSGSNGTVSGSLSGMTGSSGTSGSTGTTGSVQITGDSSSGSTGTSSDGTSDSSTSSTLTDASSSSDSSGSYETAGFTISSDETMEVSINVDELDILDIQVGQSVDVTLDAVEDQTYSGKVTEISSSGTNSGGSTKYPVTVEIAKDDNMLAGMNATATITVSSAENTLTIPAAALVEQGDSTYVYTENDDGTLSGQTEVTTGLSDGTNVVITDGLSEGDTVYYESSAGQAITNDTDETDEENGGMPGGGNFGGGGGDMPSGGGNGGGGGGMPSGGGPQGN